jgi:hypothetical protein
MKAVVVVVVQQMEHPTPHLLQQILEVALVRLHKLQVVLVALVCLLLGTQTSIPLQLLLQVPQQ